MFPPSLIGRQIFGNYTIVSPLGVGGMGSVYVAQHSELNERLAVKVLHDQYAERPEIVARFIAEARAASAIKHPNIIRVIDVGRLDTGQHYIVLEHLEGYPLGAASLPLAVGDCLAILAQVCSGLAAAHARGIIHRDLKPANLFVAPQPGNPLFTKILDFGVAKLIDDTADGGVHTQSHAVLGTPKYMAPEQARDSGSVTPSADIYALGVILFKLLTGRTPYEASSLPELISRQLSMPVPDPRDFQSDLPPAVCSLVCRTLSLEPDARPPTAREFAEQLTEAIDDGVSIARSVGFVPEGSRHSVSLATSDVTNADSVRSIGLGRTLTAPETQRAATPGDRPRRWLPVAAGATALGAVAAALFAWAMRSPHTVDAGATHRTAIEAGARDPSKTTIAASVDAGAPGERPPGEQPMASTDATPETSTDAPADAAPTQPAKRKRRPRKRPAFDPATESWDAPRDDGPFVLEHKR